MLAMFDDTAGLAVAEPEEMAKKKAPPPPPEPVKRKSGQEIILVYKADPSTAAEFKAWLEGLSEHFGAPVTVTLDIALKEFAARQKYRPMPKRLAR
jgi:hypothetical protein